MPDAGTGTLISEEMRWIPAETNGFVQKTVVELGRESRSTPFCAGIEGVLELVPVDVGQQVLTGSNTWHESRNPNI